jgi:hypothetical protein
MISFFISKIKPYVFSFTQMQGQEGDKVINIRSLAGLILKNNIRLFYARFPEPVKDYIKRYG